MDYTLRYLPIAKQDLADAINFILNECHIPIAAKILWIKLNRQLCSVLKMVRNPLQSGNLQKSVNIHTEE